MTFYQELQLNQAGSKNLIKSTEDKKEKMRHMAVYGLKVLLTVGFCIGFVTVFNLLLGEDNGVVGVAVLLSLLAFRQVNLGFDTRQSVWVMMGLFVILAAGPRAANILPPAGGFVVNLVCILCLLVFGCHNVIFFNHATFVLSYLILYGYDVQGRAYMLRVAGLLAGGLLVSLCLYRNHRKVQYKRSLGDVLHEFCLESTRSQWQIKLTLGVSLAMLLGQLLGLPRTMWIGIAVMSTLQPFDADRRVKMKYRFLGTIGGCLCFLVLVRLLPESMYGMLGVIGGIGVGFSATYKWQTVFNAFGALGMAMGLFGAGASVVLRILNNSFAVAFVLIFVPVFDRVVTRALAPACRQA